MSAAHPNSAASFSTFAGMHTNEDWSSQQAKGRQRGDSSGGGDGAGLLEEEDEIVQELPIVLNQDLAHTLYLMQSPMRPPHRPYDVELGSRVSLQVKPIQKKVEMSYRLPEAGVIGAPVTGVKPEHPGHNFDYEHAYSQVKTVTLQGKNVQPKTNYCAGVLRNGVLHLTPISAVCRFKPQLGYIDDAAAAAAASSDVAREAHRAERLSQGRMTEDEEIEMEEEQDLRTKEEEKKKELQTVVMKVDRKKGAAAAAAGANGAPGAGGAAGAGAAPGVMRKQTYAYIKQLEENEKWIPLKLHEQESPPSLHQLNRLVVPPSACLPPSIPFNVPAHHYLSYVNPPDLSETSSSESMIATGDPLYLSFDERLLYFMRNARMVHFAELCVKMQIVHDTQMEHALQLLSQMCWMVQGCWVLKSAIVYDRNWRPGVPVPHPTLAAAHTGMSAAGRASRPVSDRVQLAREYLLTQFARRRVQYRDELLQTVQLELEPLDELLNEIARCTSLSAQQQQAQGLASRAQWEWKIDTDHTFAKQ